MKYYIHEKLNAASDYTAFKKARTDVEKILNDEGFLPLEVKYLPANRYNFKERIKRHFDAYKIWSTAANLLKKGDILFIQYPEDYDFIFFDKFVKQLNKKGVITIGLIHDIDIFRFGNRGYSKIGWMLKKKIEKNKICSFSHLIVLNDNMKKMLNDNFGISINRLHSLYLWDYLNSEDFLSNKSKDLPIMIAGFFDKERALYLRNLPENVNFEIYGKVYEEIDKNNVCHKGVFSSEELISNLNGGFGLIWYGNSRNTCDGVFGEYYKIINPHKASLFLSSGIPLIIWEEAGIAKFVLDNKCGVTISSLDDIRELIDNLTNEEYDIMVNNARKIGHLMREGHFLRQVLKEVLNEVCIS